MKWEGYNTDVVAVAHSGFYVHCDKSFIGFFCPIAKQEFIGTRRIGKVVCAVIYLWVDNSDAGY